MSTAATAPDQNSAYKVLIDKNAYSQQPKVERGTRTRSLLAGSFGKPNPPPPTSYYTSAPMPPQTPNSSAPPPPLNSMATSGHHFGNPLLPSYGQNMSMPNAASRYGPYGLGASATQAPPAHGFFGAPPPSLPAQRRHYRPSRSFRSESSSGSRESSRRSARSSRNSRRRRDKYNITDSEDNSDSGSEYSDESSRHDPRHRGLSSAQKRSVLNTIREYVPENMQGIVYEDIISQMDQMHEKGYRLPKGYDQKKHNLDENEIRLYEQQLQRDKKRDQKKVSQMVNFAALGLSWFCQFISVDWIKTKHLPEIVRTALEDGEFEDSVDGIGKHLRGSVFDNPMFSTVLKFVEKVGEAHHRGVEEEQDELEEREENRTKRTNASLKNLNKFRQAPAAAAPAASAANPPAASTTKTASMTKTAPAFDVPHPDTLQKKTK